MFFRDTAGQERYETLTQQYYRRAQVKTLTYTTAVHGVTMKIPNILCLLSKHMYGCG